jgi:dTDP-4-dehydrorhamnose 3,5-epimerase
MALFCQATHIDGVILISSELFRDDRGFFERIFCQNELNIIKKDIVIAQINHSMTKKKGTIRGMHFQRPPYAEMKIFRCIKGCVFDVAIDLRKDSPTFLHWHGEFLSADNMESLVIPEGCAHGFQSLENDIEVIYMSSTSYCKDAEDGIRFDDPKVGIKWPLPVTTLSEKDKNWEYL